MVLGSIFYLPKGEYKPLTLHSSYLKGIIDVLVREGSGFEDARSEASVPRYGSEHLVWVAVEERKKVTMRLVCSKYLVVGFPDFNDLMQVKKQEPSRFSPEGFWFIRQLQLFCFGVSTILDFEGWVPEAMGRANMIDHCFDKYPIQGENCCSESFKAGSLQG